MQENVLQIELCTLSEAETVRRKVHESEYLHDAGNRPTSERN